MNVPLCWLSRGTFDAVVDGQSAKAVATVRDIVRGSHAGCRGKKSLTKKKEAMMNHRHRIANRLGSFSHKRACVLFAATLLTFSLPAMAQTPPAPSTGAGMDAAMPPKGMSKPMTGDIGQAMKRGMKELEARP
jgi:hypothetical protein